MSHNPIEIKEGAFFISDAHYSPRRPQLLDFLRSIKNQELKPTQLIFMGDIFDALFGSIKRTYTPNQDVIDLINELSLSLEVIYLEGNHDFNLKRVFKNSKVFTIGMQPVECSYKDEKLYLAHGDFVGSYGYKLYTAFVRNPIVLLIFNIFNFASNNLILNNLDKHLSKKNDCTEIKNFNDIIEKRLSDKYNCKYFIEGHFHQNKFIKYPTFNYINLAAFACNQRYFIVKSSHEELLVEKIFSKG